jgi:hypothetical protein
LGAERDANPDVAGQSRAAIRVGVASAALQAADPTGAAQARSRVTLLIGRAALAPAGALIGACVFCVMADP